MKIFTIFGSLVEYPWIIAYLIVVLLLEFMDRTVQKTATEYAVADNTNIKKGDEHMLGYDFLQASSEEKLITILVLIGALAVVGITSLISKRRKKN